MNPGQNWRNVFTSNKKEIFIAVPILLSLVLFSFLMRYQDWRNKPLSNWDMLVYYLGAESMIHDGTMMEKGDLSSYHSYQPPGAVYLILPASILLKDLRLYSLPGDLMINIAAMVFLYLLIRESFGWGLALATGVVYGCSRLVFMGVWPIGHPAFELGMLWFLMQWIRKRSAWWLFGALVIVFFGLYVDLAILPFLFVLPVLWILFRPPLRPLPVILACVIGFLLWYPYLHYEATQNFKDIQSIFFLRSNPNPGETVSQIPTYCYATLPAEMDSINETYIPYLGTGQGMDRVVFYEPGWEKYHRICWLLTNMDRNFDGGYFLTTNTGVSAVLWFFFLLGMFQTVGMSLANLEGKVRWIGRLRNVGWKFILGACLLISCAAYAVMNPDLLGKFSADGKLFQATALVVFQLKYYLPLICSAGILGLAISLRAPKRDLKDLAPLLVVWIPWLLLVILAERTRSERFFWIWPLQVAVLVFAVFQTLEVVVKNAWWKRAAVVALAILVFPLSFYLPSIQGWMKNGFSGKDNAQIQVVDFLKGEVETDGRNTISLGYSLLSTYYVKIQSEDTRMRPGSWFDLLLETRWGIHNINQSPDGLAPGDEWRIIESENPSLSVPSPWEGFIPVAVFDPYVVFRAEGEPLAFRAPIQSPSDGYAPASPGYFLLQGFPGRRVIPFWGIPFRRPAACF